MKYAKQYKETLVKFIDELISLGDKEVELFDRFKIDLFDFLEDFHKINDLAIDLLDAREDINWYIYDAQPRHAKKIIVTLKNNKKINITKTKDFVDFITSENLKLAKDYDYDR